VPGGTDDEPSDAEQDSRPDAADVRRHPALLLGSAQTDPQQILRRGVGPGDHRRRLPPAYSDRNGRDSPLARIDPALDLVERHGGMCADPDPENVDLSDRWVVRISHSAVGRTRPPASRVRVRSRTAAAGRAPDRRLYSVFPLFVGG
jgi:hypothetical protein